jgi:hypothetical protein
MSTESASTTTVEPVGGPPPASAALHEMLFGAMAAKVVYAGSELGVPELLAGGVRTSAQLAAQLGAHEPSLRRLLRALAGLEIVSEPEPDSFDLAPGGQLLLAGHPRSMRNLVAMLCGPDYWRAWEEIVPGVLRGERAWDRAHGVDWLEYYERNPGPAAVFHRAMSEHTRDAAPGLIAGAELGRFDAVMDVGGGDGRLIAEMLAAHPELVGIVFDLPEAIASAPGVLEAAGVAERCEVVPGDFFASVPSGADAYVLKQVLHDWDDDRALAILRNVRAAMARDSRLLILERMLPERVGPDDAPTLLIDVLMLLVTGGKERTETEFRGLLGAAGLELARVGEPIPPFGYRVIEAVALGASPP